MNSGQTDDEYRWKMLQRQVQELRIATIFKALDEQRIEALLIKGWAAARNYPQPFERLSLDVDAAVKPESYAAAEKYLEEREIRGVDLHEGLRHLDTLAWNRLYARAETVEIGGARVKILCAEDHLRVLCAHWLGDGGADKERLRDIFYAVENRPVDFDWERCLDAAGLKRRKWTVCAVGLARKYLGLDLAHTPLVDEAKDLPRWLTETVEREWTRNIRLKPLHLCLGSGKEFYEQIKLRVPPNPIQATVDVGGAFDEGTRVPHQIGSLFVRFKPSLKRIGQVIFRRRARR